MIEATYGLNSFMSNIVDLAGYGPLTFYPGTYAGQGAADNYVVYNVVPSTGLEYYFVHADDVTYKIYHTKFDTLKHIEDTIIENLNVDNIQYNTALSQSGVRYLTTHAQSTFSGQAIYIEGQDYYVVQINVTLIYTTP